ncbi:MAG: AAA family ATPase [Defluviitaleaceae bacterium]|nr:AAA family ATPase [Defluviitaleaceae bacterium]
MIIWVNGAFGSGKSTTAVKLQKLLSGSHIYDPEEAGFFIRDNVPKTMLKDDFQDIPLWREINYKMLRTMSEGHNGDIIVPMTLINPEYYHDIIGRLTAEGVDVRHFILYLDKNMLAKRLRKRASGFIHREKFALDSIDCCIHSYDNYITETKIMAHSKSADDIALEIVNLCKL